MHRRFLISLVLLVVAPLAYHGGGTTLAQEPIATFRGTANGRDTSHTVDLRPGLVVVRARHAGSSNFILELVLPKPGVDIQREYDEAVYLINHIGQYNGGAAGKVRKGGTYTLDIQASGSYEIIVEQPPLTQIADEGQLEFSGKSQQVTPVFTMPAGARRITFTHEGDGVSGSRRPFAQVWLYDMEGNTVAGESGRLFNEFDPFEGTVELEIILDGPHIFEVDATGSWTLRIE